MSKDPVIHPRHIHAAGLCMAGARDWFARYGWTMADCRQGRITASQVREKDALGERVARAAEEEQ